MTTPQDIRAHRVARMERIANAGECFLARLSHLAQGWSDAEVVAGLGLVWHKIARDIEIATLLQMRIENGWTERAAAEPRAAQPASPHAPEPQAPGLRLPELHLPILPPDLLDETFCQDLADAEVIVSACSNDDPYVRPNLDRIIERARKDRRDAHVKILTARRDIPLAKPP